MLYPAVVSGASSPSLPDPPPPPSDGLYLEKFLNITELGKKVNSCGFEIMNIYYFLRLLFVLSLSRGSAVTVQPRSECCGQRRTALVPTVRRESVTTNWRLKHKHTPADNKYLSIFTTIQNDEISIL